MSRVARSLLLSTALTAFVSMSPARAQTASTADLGPGSRVVLADGQQIGTKPPPGFENLTAPIDTMFDVYYLNRRVGSFRARLEDNHLTFAEPRQVAAALTGLILPDAAIRLLSLPLDLNEQYRCFPGQTTNCGLLPPGKEGAIVDADRFSVELFFKQEDVVQKRVDSLILGPSMSGPSLVQNVAFSVATSDGFGSGVRFGGTFNTAASIGQTALIAQTLVDDQQGVRLNNGYVQHIWNNRIARVGLFEDYSTKLLTSYRMAGAEFASFYPPKAYEAGIATPIQVVLPRDADVELRRAGVLVSVRHYQAGLQTLDTSGLPDGSYPLSITARADGAVVLQEVRSFTRAAGLPIPGKTEFALRAGLYASDQFDLDPRRSQPFLPSFDGRPVISGRVARRIGAATGAELNALLIDGHAYGEASLITFTGTLQGILTGAVGDNGTYGALISGSRGFGNVRVNLTARATHANIKDFDLATLDNSRYRPFFRSERSIFASATFPLLAGSMNLSAGYTRYTGLQDDYSVDLRYTRAVRLFRRSALLSTFARASTRDTRVGFTISFDFGIDRNTTASLIGGGEAVTQTDGASRKGLSPIVNASVSHRNRFLGGQMVSQAGISTDADSDRAFASTDLASSLGQLDVTGQYMQTRDGSSFNSLFANGQTGFAIGGGAAKIGLAQSGTAVILSDIGVTKDGTEDRSPPGSGYRIKINSQSADLITPGHTSAVGVAPYEEYDVALEPENAPPYEIDTKTHHVTVYPGNVVRLHYEATHSFSLFGQLIDEDGRPISGGRVLGGDDSAITDDEGYFTITASGTTSLDLRDGNGKQCKPRLVGDLIGAKPSLLLNRIGKLTCIESDRQPATKARAGAGQSASNSADEGLLLARAADGLKRARSILAPITH